VDTTNFVSSLRLPEILLGAGRSAELPAVLRRFGRRALFVVRSPGFVEGREWARLQAGLWAAGIDFTVENVSTEPSPAMVDDIVARVRAGSTWSDGMPVDVVVGIGGGSVLDAAKAVAGLLIPGNSVMDHLEGVGPGLAYGGQAVPIVAVPTTAGTGSEATRNAVLSIGGPGGFKRSFRDDALIPRVAIVDPDMLAGCTPKLIASNGMDALTQLLESYVSARSTPQTRETAVTGLTALRESLRPWFDEAVAGRGAGGATLPAREKMAAAALCSGICLAQTGLGAVHGVASPLGALFPVPHGVACGATLAAATRVNIAALRSRDPEGWALGAYAELGRLMTGGASGAASDDSARTALISELQQMTAHFEIPSLSAFGIRERDIPSIVADSRGSSMATNPIKLADDEISEILLASL
jgi:alcohol dehydrogenase